VLEKTREFSDRVHGEALLPWGCEEAARQRFFALDVP
jgi:hypothetical protein